VHCHTITSGAASACQSKANKITTEGYVPQILNHQRHYVIGNFKWFVYSIKEQENKKTYQPHRGDGATKLRMILKD